jgi:hypothetical protein
VVALLILTSVSASTQTSDEEHLRALVKAHARERPGEPYRMVGPVGDFSPKSVAELSQEAELVVLGRLSKPRTYVGPGGALYSDYAIQDRRVLAGQSDTVIARSQLASMPLILTRYGDEMTIDGVQVRAERGDGSDVKEGREYLMFLTPSRGGGVGRYESYGGAIFGVELGLIRPLIRNGDIAFPDGFDAPLPVVSGQIERAAKVRPKK